jgi:hypothetical protein
MTNDDSFELSPEELAAELGALRQILGALLAHVPTALAQARAINLAASRDLAEAQPYSDAYIEHRLAVVADVLRHAEENAARLGMPPPAKR